MKIDYQKIFKKNIINILIDVSKTIEQKGLTQGHHLYVTFDTNHKKVLIPKWLKDKYPNEMTIVIQYEYYNLKVKEEKFLIGLSFNDIKTNLEISYESVISFADPYSNFGLKLIEKEKGEGIKSINKNKKTNNVIDFTAYKDHSK